MSSTDQNQGSTILEGYGVTRSGFRRPDLDTIYEAAIEEAEDQFGRRLTAPTSSEAQYVDMLALFAHQYYETLQALYFASYYATARGEQLDYLLSRYGFERLDRREATGEATFFASGGTADEDVEIAAGTRISTPEDETGVEIFFQTTEVAVIPAGEDRVEEVPIKGLNPDDPTVTLDLDDEQLGEETNVAAGTITELVDRPSGVESVTNPLPTGTAGERADGSYYDFVTGRDRELDDEFRGRYEAARGSNGRATPDAIEAAIRQAGDGTVVREVSVEEDLPIREVGGAYIGRQIEPAVWLEDDILPYREAVSQAILDSRGAGIESIGPMSRPAERAGGVPYDTGLGFSLVEEIPLEIEAELVVDPDQFGPETIADMEENLVSRIDPEPQGQQYRGTGVGEDVYYTWIIGDILDDDIPGWLDYNRIEIGRLGSALGTSNVTINWDEVATLDPSDITITTVQQ